MVQPQRTKAEMELEEEERKTGGRRQLSLSGGGIERQLRIL
jgi:hypothetical protein